MMNWCWAKVPQFHKKKKNEQDLMKNETKKFPLYILLPTCCFFFFFYKIFIKKKRNVLTAFISSSLSSRANSFAANIVIELLKEFTNTADAR